MISRAEVTIDDCKVIPLPVEDVTSILWLQLRKSVRVTCKHSKKIVVNRSRTGNSVCYAGYRCPDCNLAWNEKVDDAEHQDALSGGGTA